MSVPAATVTAIGVLAAAGALPVLAAVGRRWVAVPLAPLAGGVVAAGAATVEVVVPGPFVVWFAILALTGAVASLAWWRHRGPRPRRRRPAAAPTHPGLRWLAGAGAVGTFATTAVALRGLATPTVGFDARALWLMRAGWFLQGHHQLVVDLRLPELVLPQSAYPPLVSAVTAISWAVTGLHTARLGVTVVAVLNGCAVAAAALAVLECGQRAAARADRRSPSWAPAVAGAVAAPLLVVVAAGVTTPFLTNGYADPIWSVAAVGALAWGLQVQPGGPTTATTALLLVVAGLSKDEGVVIGAALALLIVARVLVGLPSGERLRRGRRSLVVAGAELAILAAWPLVMRVIQARGITSSYSSPSTFPARARAAADGFAPYLHVLVLAVPLAVAGGLVLGRVRRRAGLGNDAWAWAGLASGLLAIGGALVTGTAAVRPWLLTTVHRITEFPVLAAWWIVAVWGIVGAAALVAPDVVAGPPGPGDGAGDATVPVADGAPVAR